MNEFLVDLLAFDTESLLDQSHRNLSCFSRPVNSMKRQNSRYPVQLELGLLAVEKSPMLARKYLQQDQRILGP